MPISRRKTAARRSRWVRSLRRACELFESGERDAAAIKRQMMELFDEAPGVTVDYRARRRQYASRSP